ncbi:mucin-17-like [Denticeps clupeoides]|uniref:mucin-17-like n=1 Tax=Denticeps clupeoides TaxID=299321 RepID=UPI0010A375A3|nr:mucin-17-like [Denticeps clupeoides]
MQELGAGVGVGLATHLQFERTSPREMETENESRKSRKFKCKQRPVVVSDFGESLLESEQAEADFSELSLGDVSSAALSKESAPESTGIGTREPFSEREAYTKRHIEEISDRFYRALYGKSLESNSEDEAAEYTEPGAGNKEEIHSSAGKETFQNPTVDKSKFSNERTSLERTPESKDQPPDRVWTVPPLLDPTIISLDSASDHAADMLSPTSVHVEAGHEVSQSITKGITTVNFTTLTETEAQIQDRPLTPDSMSECSADLEMSFGEDRAPSPESETPIDECRPLSPDSPIPEYRPESPDSAVLMPDIRLSSPESIASLSPDSPVPDYRPPTPLPPVLDYDTSDFSWHFTESSRLLARCSGLLSLECTSLETFRPVSPGSFVESRSISRESVTFGIEERTSSPEQSTDSTENRPLSPEDYVAEARPSSPESRASGALSPDSPVLCFSQPVNDLPSPRSSYRSSPALSVASSLKSEPMSPVPSDLERRPSSPESMVSVNEYRELSPDSPTPQFSLPLPECEARRPSSSIESLCSEAPSDYEPFVFNEFLSQRRPESPESSSSVNHLSLDSPIPQFRQDLPEVVSVMDGHSSPESLSSDPEYSTFPLDTSQNEPRADSPESVGLGHKHTPVSSLASPARFLEHYTGVPVEQSIVTGDNPGKGPRKRAKGKSGKGERTPSGTTGPHASLAEVVSPEATASMPEYNLVYKAVLPTRISHVYDTQYRGETFCPKAGVFERPGNRPELGGALAREDGKGPTEDRPLSVDSVPECRPTSLNSADLIGEFRASSPESVGSVNELKSLSPDSPVPQYFEHILSHETFITGYRSESSGSTTSEMEIELLVTSATSRPSSPESLASVNGTRPLSPDSPLPTYCQSASEYFEQIKGCRSSPSESEAFISELTSLQRRADSPESIASEAEERPLSPDSAPEYRPLSPDYRQDLRTSSPESDTFKPLSPDSPVPQYLLPFTDTYTLPGWRCDTPESVLSEFEYTHAEWIQMAAGERPSSPESTGSCDKYRPLPPDSPVPEYAFESARVVAGHRSASPESPCSDMEYAPLLVDVCRRASSPESVAESLSPDSPVPQYSYELLGVAVFISGHRSDSPVSATSEVEYGGADLTDLSAECRPESVASLRDSRLSPDSPILDFRPVTDSWVPVAEYGSSSSESESSETSEVSDLLNQRPESPESVASDAGGRPLSPDSIPEYRPLSPDAADLRASSPESEASLNEFKSLSPDSPIPQYQSPFVDLYRGQRSETPDSVISEIEYALSDWILISTQQRCSSPESTRSFNEDRALSPDSPVPEYTPSVLTAAGYRSSSPESADSETESEPSPPDLYMRTSSPESVASLNELKPLPPDSPVPQYLVHFPESSISMSEEPSESPESATSDIEYSFTEFTFIEPVDRASSPESTESVSECRPLSPDSPVPQYLPPDGDSTDFITDNRSETPESLTSEIEFAHKDLFISVEEERCSSPDSTTSIGEYRHLSPDSPVPHFTPVLIEPVTGYRSSSPESVTLQTDREPYVAETFDQRPESPESVASDADGRPLSPDSILEYRPLSPDAADLRASSPESEASLNEFKSLSPDSPIPQYQSPFVDLYRGQRSETPDSVISEIEYALSDWILISIQQRCSSPESTRSFNEDRALSPDSPVPEYTPSVLTAAGYRSSSPESADSETESELSPPDLYTRTSSPESVASLNELKPLPPDSPVPQYLVHFPESLIPMSEEPSESPESATSDIEYSFTEFTFIEPVDRASSPESTESVSECRPLSPDSPVPQYLVHFPQSSIATSEERSESPESATSDIEYSFTEFTFIEPVDRASSPESTESVSECRPLSPDSPVPQYLVHFPESSIATSEERSESPESATSDIEYSFTELNFIETEERPSSPESTASISETRPLPPDSPVPQYLVHFPESSISMSEEPSESPESATSDIEYSFTEFTFIEPVHRASSPESTASISEYRPLPPDSPVPEFTPVLTEYEFRYMSSSPESVASEGENESLPSCHIARASSPESVASLNEFKSLSPDSPTPQFSVTSFETAMFMTHSRSASPESAASDIQLCDCGVVVDDARPLSPESTASVHENRSLSPDSPVPEFIGLVQECRVPSSGFRLSSPESAISQDGDHKFNDAYRPDSPQSASSPDSVSEFGLSAAPQVSFGSPAPVTLSVASESAGDVDPVTERREPPASVCETGLLQPDCFEPGIPLCTSAASEVDRGPAGDDLAESGPTSPDSVASGEENPLADEKDLLPPTSDTCFLLDRHQEHATEDTTLRFVRKAVISTLISSVHDPQYRGETFTSKPGVFERVTFRSTAAGLGRLSPDSLSGYDRSSAECSCDSRPPSPQSELSLDENRPLSPDSPVPGGELSFPHPAPPGEESRASSPESASSVSEFRQLSPDSPIPEYRPPSPCHVHHVHAFRENLPTFGPVGTLHTMTLHIVTAHEAELRPPSPSSVVSDNDSRSFSPQTIWLEPDHRYPSPEAHDLDAAYERSPSPCLEVDRPSSPESIASCQDEQTQAPRISTIEESREMYESVESVQVEKEKLTEQVKNQEEVQDHLATSIETVVEEHFELTTRDFRERVPQVSDKEVQVVQQKGLKRVDVSEEQADVLGSLVKAEPFFGLQHTILASLQFGQDEIFRTHRAVTPNLPEGAPKPRHESVSPASVSSLMPPDYQEVVSGFGKVTSGRSPVSPTDTSPLSPVFSPESFQPSPGFRHVLSEFEKTLSSFEEEKHTAKRKLLVHTESVKSEGSEGAEFFDCSQNFSDVSEPEPDAELNRMKPLPVCRIVEPLPLPDTPNFEFLAGSPADNVQTPVSLSSDDLDLPIILEPEDEGVGYEGQQAVVCGYTGSLAEELPPRQGAYYEEEEDEDDDSLGRVRL